MDKSTKRDIILPTPLKEIIANLETFHSNFKADRDRHKVFSDEWELNQRRRIYIKKAINNLRLTLQLDS